MDFFRGKKQTDIEDETAAANLIDTNKQIKAELAAEDLKARTFDGTEYNTYREAVAAQKNAAQAAQQRQQAQEGAAARAQLQKEMQNISNARQAQLNAQALQRKRLQEQANRNPNKADRDRKSREGRHDRDFSRSRDGKNY